MTTVRETYDPASSTSVVGTSVPRLDGRAKVTGQARYAEDHIPRGALHAAVQRSQRPHARLVSVDTRAALGVEGVIAVLTGADLYTRLGERIRSGPAFADQPILALERVRYVGEPIAVVVAETRAAAIEAARLVEVEYEDLSAVHDARAALAPEASLVHEVLRPSHLFKDLAHLAGTAGTNLVYEYTLRRGDVETGLRQASQTVDATYTSPPVSHAAIEPHGTVAWIEDDVLQIVSATQTPSYVREALAAILDLPLHRVRVRVPYLGGGFGAKMYDRLEPLVGVLAWQLRRPVAMVLSREEVFVITSKHGVSTRMQVGAASDGTLLATAADIVWDTGAYADIGPRITSKSGMVAGGPYRTPNVSISSKLVYTNKVSAGPYRGFGVPQMIWAHECAIDELARALGRDPYELRRRNLLREGEQFATGTPVHSAAVVECLDRVAEAVEWTGRRRAAEARYAYGKGIAVGVKAVITPTISGAVVQLNADASATILSSTVEMGQGSSTIMPQIVAETLGLDASRVSMVQPDTAVTPYDTITAGSRSTYHMGNAVRLAAERVRDQLFDTAAAALECAPEDLVAHDACVSQRGNPSARLSIADIFDRRLGSRGTTLTGEVTYQTQWVPFDHDTGQSPAVTEHWFAAATAAEVRVDRWTGRIHILRLAVAGDVGRAINPAQCRQQLEGAAIMGIGQALFDEMIFDEGQLLNGTFLDYQLPSVLDLPDELIAIVVEERHRAGPYGAKGVGETGILTTTPAIANALADATGVRLRSLPLTAERVLLALP
ncbi:MAG TPA: xanthine dehydrogenase family protein molybdopterin-binding subunit [Chloroflexota bacterium]|nr:xanthine dehydrogenase family protein molybdopterin-binding subunit [Chloroflexota bacterium]